MSGESIDIVINDRVSEEPAKKIKAIADNSRDAHAALKELKAMLGQISDGAVGKLNKELTGQTKELSKQGVAIERLQQAQLKTAKISAGVEAAQAKANNATRQGELLQQRLTNVMKNGERATLSLEMANVRLQRTREGNIRSMAREGDAMVKLYEKNLDRQAKMAMRPQTAPRMTMRTGEREGDAAVRAFTAQQAADAAKYAKELENVSKRSWALMGAVDPLIAAQHAYNKTVNEANTLLAKGGISQAQHTQVVNMATQALHSHAGAQHKVAESAKLTRFQMLTLQYTVNDVVASLASGANPLTILLQQGGQVTQAWGGLGATMRAAAGAVMTVTGATVGMVAAGAGVLLFLDMANSEFAGFQRQLDLTRGSAGLTAGMFVVMSERIADASKTGIGAAQETAMAYAATGRLQKEQIEQLSVATLNFAQLSGISSEKIVKDWSKMIEKPGDFAREMLMQYGVFTPAQLAHIRLLEDTGRKTEAVNDVSRKLYEYFGKEAPQHLGYLERAWNGVANALSRAWEGMKAIGRGSSTAELFAASQTAVSNIEKRLEQAAPHEKGELKARLADERLRMGNLQRSAEMEERAARAKAAGQESTKKAVVAIEKLDSYSASVADNVVKANQAVEAFRKSLSEAAANPDTAKDPKYLNALKNQAKIEQGLRDQFMPDAKKAAKQGLEDIERQDKLISELSGTTKTYKRDVEDLTNAKTRLNMSEMVYGDLMAKLKAKQPEELARTKALQDAYNEQVRFADEVGEARKREDDMNNAARQSMTEYERSIRLAGEASQFEIGLMNVGIEKRGRLLAIYQAEVALKEKLREIDMSGLSGAVKTELSDKARAAQPAVINNVNAQLTLDILKEIEQYTDPTKAQNFGDALSDAFGRAGEAISKMTGALQDNYTKQVELDRLKSKLSDDKTMDPVEKAKAEMKLTQKQSQLQIKSYGDMAGAAKGFFKEGSKGYKALEAAEKTFRAFELAQSAINFAAKMGWITAETAAVVTGESVKTAAVIGSTTTQLAADQVQGLSAAAVGVATQAKGEPYTAWARMAMMAAAMAALGFAVGGGGGSGGPPREMTAAYRQERQGTGTVLGDESAKSESITRSLEILESNSDIALKHSSNMLAALRSIDDGISGMATFVARSAGLRGTVADGKALGVGSSKSAFGFGSKSTTLTDTGIIFDRISDTLTDLDRTMVQLPGRWVNTGGNEQEVWEAGRSVSMREAGMTGPLRSQSIGDIRTGGIAARGYSDIHSEKSSWWGLSKSSSDTTVFNDLDQSLLKQMTLTIDTLFDGVMTAATGVFGKESGALETALNNITLEDIGLDRISLKGLSGDELEAELQAVFSMVGDKLAEVAMPGLNDFQKVGEGYFETLTKVASGIDTAQYALELLGVEAINYTAILNKQGDVATELVRGSIMVVEKTGDVSTGIGEIVATLTGSVSDLTSVYSTLTRMRDEFNAYGLNGNNINRDTIRGAGGLESLGSGASTFFENFYTPQEQLTAKLKMLKDQFIELGVAVPTSAAGYRALVLAANDGTEAGSRLTGRLLAMSGAVYDAVESSDALRESINDTAQELRDKLIDAVSDALATLKRVIGNEKDRLKKIYDKDLDALTKRKKLADDRLPEFKKIADMLKSAVETLAQNEQLGLTREAAVANLDTAIAIARSTGNLPDPDDFKDTLAVITRPSADLFKSFVDYSRDFDKQAAKVAELSEIADSQLTTEEKILTELKAEQDLMETLYKLEVERLDSIVDMGQLQLDALNGLDTSVMTITAAIAALNAALLSASAGTGIATRPVTAAGSYVTGPGAAPVTDTNTQGYSMGHAISAIQISYANGFSVADIQTGAANYGVTGATFEAAMHAAGIPGFATGGWHAGGMAMVGENGPELIRTRGQADIFNNRDTMSMLNGGYGMNTDMSSVVGSIEDFAYEQREANAAIITQLMKMAGIFEGWDTNGMPAEDPEWEAA